MRDLFVPKGLRLYGSVMSAKPNFSVRGFSAGQGEIVGEMNVSPMWTPFEVITEIWLDAADSNTITLNGSTVSQWNDKSGNTRHATQGTIESQPTKTSDGVQFDGVNDYMTISVPQAKPSHVFAVINTAPLQTGYRTLLNRTVGSAPYPPCLFVGSDTGNYKPSIYWGSAKILVDSTARQNLRIQEFRLGASTAGLRVNGGAEQSVSHNQSALSTWIEINTVNTYSAQGAFSLGELIIVNSSLSDADRQKIEGYMAHKWDALLGVTTLVDALPLDHPYKSAPPTI